MAIQTIGYANKVALNENTDVADINKVTDDDMNEIKDVVNTNANLQGDLENLNTDDKTNLVMAINSLSKTIYDNTLTANSNHVSIPCDILRDGGVYELTCIGKVTDKCDIFLKLNNISADIYYQSGFGYNFTGTTSDDTGTLWQGYRPGKSGFYITNVWNSNENARSITKHTISLLQAGDFPVMTSQSGVTFAGNSQNGLASCQTSEAFNNITTIDLYPSNGGQSFVAGSRFILKKL